MQIYVQKEIWRQRWIEIKIERNFYFISFRWIKKLYKKVKLLKYEKNILENLKEEKDFLNKI